MATPITVTATLTDPSGTLLQGNAFLRFRLRNFAGFVPQVSGSAIIPENQVDGLPNASGVVTQNLWRNADITPSTTFYTVELWNQGRPVSSGNYIFNANTNLNTASQINTPPVPAGFSLVLENNGVLNSSQSTLNLESTDGSVAITDVGSGTLNLQAALASFTTAGLGYFWGGRSFGPLTTNATPLTNVANQVRVCQLILETAFTIRKVTVRVASNTAGASSAVVGIYTNNGNTQLLSATFDTSVSGALVQTVTLGSPVVLPAGIYVLAWSDSSTTPNLAFSNQFNALTNLSTVMNASVVRVGTAANAMSGNVLPATLGTITAASFDIPGFFFEV